MMRRSLIMMAGLAALSGCSGGESTKESAAASGQVSVKNASANEVAEQVEAASAAGGMFEPGQWAGTIRTIDLTIPGVQALTPAVRERLQKQIGAAKPFTSCLTPEQAKDPKNNLLGNQTVSGCTYDHFDMANGKIDAAMSCKAPTGNRTMTMKGTYSRSDYQMQMESKGAGTGPTALSLKMELTAKRVGTCVPAAEVPPTK